MEPGEYGASYALTPEQKFLEYEELLRSEEERRQRLGISQPRTRLYRPGEWVIPGSRTDPDSVQQERLGTSKASSAASRQQFLSSGARGPSRLRDAAPAMTTTTSLRDILRSRDGKRSRTMQSRPVSRENVHEFARSLSRSSLVGDHVPEDATHQRAPNAPAEDHKRFTDRAVSAFSQKEYQVAAMESISPPAFFPLSSFDHCPTQLRTDTEVLSFPLRGKSLSYDTRGEAQWRDCTVLAYDAAAQKFAIQWQANGRQKRASRLNTVLEGETLEQVLERRQFAEDARWHAEAVLRFNIRVQDMPAEHAPPLAKRVLQSIAARAQSSARMSADTESMQQLLEEVRSYYNLSMNKLEYNLFLESFGQPLRIMGESDLAPRERTVPDCGTVSRTHAQVQELAKAVRRELSWSIPEITEALYRVRAVLETVSSVPVFDLRTERPRSLPEFLSAQEEQLSIFREHMTLHIGEAVLDILAGSAARVENAECSTDGGLQTRERLRRAQSVIRRMMGTEVLSHLESEMERFISSIETRVDKPLRHPALYRATEDSDGMQNDEEAANLHELHIAPTPALVCIAVAGDHDIHGLSLTPSPSECFAQISDLFDLACGEIASICFGEQAEAPVGLHHQPPLVPAESNDAAARTRTGAIPRDNATLVETSILQVLLDEGKRRMRSILERASMHIPLVLDTLRAYQVDLDRLRESSPSSPLAQVADVAAGEHDHGDGAPPAQGSLGEQRTPVSEGATDIPGTSQEHPALSPAANPTGTELHAANASASSRTQRLHTQRALVDSLQKLGHRAMHDIPAHVEMGLYRINLHEFRSVISSGAQRAAKETLEQVAAEVREVTNDVLQRLAQIRQTLEEETRTPEELHKLQKFAESCETIVDEQVSRINSTKDAVAILEDAGFELAEPDAVQLWQAIQQPRFVLEVRDACVGRIDKDGERFREELQFQKVQFTNDLGVLQKDVDALRELGDVEAADEHAEQIRVLEHRVQEAAGAARTINAREDLFQQPVTSYQELLAVEKQLAPISSFWNTAAEFQKLYPEWMYGTFTSLDPEAMEADSQRWWRTLYKLEKDLSGAPDALRTAIKTVREKIEAFNENLPLLKNLRSPGMRQRHWSELNSAAGIEIVPEAMTLSQMLELNLGAYSDTVAEVADTARKEFSLERALDKMMSELRPIDFELASYRESGTHVLRSVDDLQQLLDDQILKVQTMRGSPHARSLEADIKSWERQLSGIQDILEAWLSVQKAWLYLEPIFGSDDIMRQMPAEGRRFKAVDSMLRQIVSATLDEPNVLRVCAQDGLLSKLNEAQKYLDLVSKGLSEYLEAKRLVFPRFFFLSDENLLEILSQTKDPLAVQPHLSKCFENIERLAFEGADCTVTAMQSADGEQVPFSEHVHPNAVEHKGAVEKWLGKVEQAMQHSLLAAAREAMADHDRQQRTRWVLSWPGQIVLAINQLMWTAGVSESLDRAGVKGLKMYEQKLIQQLEEIVALVRGELTPLARAILGALVVIDVHAKDVVRHMAAAGVDSTSEFEWQSQLRYYWEDESIRVRMVQATLPYAFEYLGNTPRLVITPLTDRCYRTLVGALHLTLGGAPEGPAGTGKTETTKDLAKAIAIQCVVFNCSDGLDYLAMAKFFKGLASSGAWACFDEFNRINLEVLSVIAQQVLSIQQAVREQATEFSFEGTNLQLRPSCAVFITMNPGYAGRSELPDNLKALFRTVAMMVPDYALIAEICLYSYGFNDARRLARKITSCLRLSSEQLSSQDHYDFGMRNVKSILTAAGALKQAEPDQHEDLLALRAIQDCNIPKFTEEDIPLFQGIVTDLFPGVTNDVRAHGSALSDALEQACRELHLVPRRTFLDKCVQLMETTRVRHGLMVVGRTMSAKSCVIRVLARALTLLALRADDAATGSGVGDTAGPGASGGAPVRLHTLNPKSLPATRLYGDFDDVSHEWSDGVVATTIRSCRDDISPVAHWIVFDGPVDAVWIENMNTVLDDNKKLCLNSGETIKLTPSMRIVFEVGDLSAASPATVSRCGMVFLEPGMLGWEPLVGSWLQTLPQHAGEYAHYIHTLFSSVVAPLLQFVRTHVEEPVPSSDLWLVSSLLRILEWGLFPALGVDAGEARNAREARASFGRTIASSGAPSAGTPQKRHSTESAQTEKSVHGAAQDSVAHTEDNTSTELQSPSERIDVGKGAAEKDLTRVVGSAFLYALTWSVGATGTAAGRQKLASEIARLLSTKAVEHSPEGNHAARYNTSRKEDVSGDSTRETSSDQTAPDPREKEHGRSHEDALQALARALPVSIELDTTGGSLFEYFWDPTARVWQRWSELTTQPQLSKTTAFHEIFVPTQETTAYSTLFRNLIALGYPVLLTGETGTGKTAIASKELQKLAGDAYVTLPLTFSARTSAAQTQEIIDAKLDKRRKGVFGPPVGRRAIVFVDDLNMPAREVYGAQPPLELLRQWADYSGWFDGASTQWRSIVDVQMVAAMGPPGGGRNPVSERLLRHFSMVAFVPLQDESLVSIFGFMLRWHFEAFEEEVRGVCENVVRATVALYRTVSKGLLPTPAKSHYTFNIRDLSKVFQGLMSCSRQTLTSSAQLTRLWSHECARVFRDRLVNAADESWFDNVVQEVAHTHELSQADIEAGSSAYFVHFRNLDESVALYEEAQGESEVAEVLRKVIEDHNALASAPMHLVLFKAAVAHVCRIARVISQPRGHALLVGVGGSGRQSLTRLAALACRLETFEIEMAKGYGRTEWTDDLKRLLAQAGCKGAATVFLLNDTQVRDDSFLEDVNGILNAGEVPSLFAADETESILEELRPLAIAEDRQGTREAVWEFFVQRCRENLHVVLCMSPVGDAFRDRLRMFPAFVNCCTIDWFSAWDNDALHSVAEAQLRDVDVAPEQRSAIAELCMFVHQNAQDLSADYQKELQRYNYITPTSYLDLLGRVSTLFSKKRDEVTSAKVRYETGLAKLQSTEQTVKEMQTHLEALKPDLISKTHDTEALMKDIQKEQKDANAKQAVVEKESRVAEEKARQAQEIQDDCEKDLAEALPALEAAVAAVRSLDKAAITEVKSMKNPPDGVKLVMEAVCKLLQRTPSKKVDDPKTRRKIPDYWDEARKLLSESNFAQQLQSFDKDNIPQPVIDSIQPYIKNPDFEPAKVEKVSRAANCLCKWVRAMNVYHRVAKEVAPKRAALKAARAELAQLEAHLAEKKAELQRLRDHIQSLTDQFEQANAEKEDLKTQVELCSTRLDRAQRLLGALGGEKTRWTSSVEELRVAYQTLLGDIAVSSAIICYLGAFTMSFRERALNAWLEKARSLGLAYSEDLTLEAILGSAIKIREWKTQGLPIDSFSVENAVILEYAPKWPLFVDPQGQANKWIRNKEAGGNLVVVRQAQPDFARVLENAIQFGSPVLLENVGESIDPALDPILLKQTHRVGNTLMINLGDTQIEYNESFRLYITTKLPNPHYTPDVSTKVTLLNFTITPEGLADQLLGIVVAEERPQLEKERNALIVQSAEFQRQLKELEDRILEQLSSAGGNILDDEELISTLMESKKTSDRITRQAAIARETAQSINRARAAYERLARHSALLYFCISDLGSIDPMYQYSLSWFVALYVASIGNAPASDALEVRLRQLQDTFTYALYRNVCRSLFEQHKLLFSFILTVRIMQDEERVDPAEWRHMLTGGSSLSTEREADSAFERPAWLPETAWRDLGELEVFPAFHRLRELISGRCSTAWRRVYSSNEPHSMDFPGEHASLDAFRRMAVLRALRPDRVVPAVQRLISEELGERYIEPPAFDLGAAYTDARPETPLIFVLSAGADPTGDLLAYAQQLGKRVEVISLGQGQGPKAEKLIDDAMNRGRWVLLQNCHLAVSWLPRLEAICEGISAEAVHPDFRLWLTSLPSPHFPVSVLQDGIKMTNEPPKGLRANLSRTLQGVDDDLYAACGGSVVWRNLLFGLCFFHAVVQERRKYGPLGWNIPYQFNQSDFRISMQQLRMYLEQSSEIPWKALLYTTGETNYGGRVTDEWDRRLLMVLLTNVFTPRILDEGYNLSESGLYHAPSTKVLDDARQYVRSLPINEDPEVFGLHQNADTAFAVSETRALFHNVLQMQPRSRGSAIEAPEQSVMRIADEILERIPRAFDVAGAVHKRPIAHGNSMNTVLIQELLRFNRLIQAVRGSLSELRRAIMGHVVMSPELDAVFAAVYDGRVPALWDKVSYPSLRPLGSWITDLEKRIEFFQDWIDRGPPSVFWLSGFFFTQSFLTGVLQTHARQHAVPIDALHFSFRVLEPERPTSPPSTGCYISGLYLEGASWDGERNSVVDSAPKQLITEMPVIHILPRKKQSGESNHFRCPVYKTSLRRGTLSTTGHSTNFVLAIDLPSEKPADFWVKRGVALLCQLDT